MSASSGSEGISSSGSYSLTSSASGVPKLEKWRGLLRTIPTEIVGFDHLFSEQIQKSISSRSEKIKSLSNEEGRRLRELEQDLGQLNVIFDQWAKSDPSTNSSQVLEFEISELEKKILEKYLPFLLHPPTLTMDNNIKNYAFYKEVILNAFVNRCVYLKELDLALDAEFKEIAKGFGITNIKQIDWEIPGAETHNQGRSVAILTIHCQEGVKKLVYKPRNASIDLEVVNCLGRINQKISQEAALPTCKISNFKQRDASVWEYIDGKDLNGGSLGQFVEGRPSRPLAARLDQILGHMHVSDLHWQNIRIRPDGSFVPIDYENVVLPLPPSINKYTPTDLNVVGSADYKLKDGEREEINAFHRAALECPRRLIFHGTESLVRRLGSLQHYKTSTKSMLEYLVKEGATLELKAEEKIEAELIVDYLNSDVSYLTLDKGNVYFGKRERNVIIAVLVGR